MTAHSDWDFLTSVAENYERNLVPIIFAPWAHELVETACLRQGDRVLDVACGTGIVARIAARKLGGAGSVTGLDVSAPMIMVARATALTEGVAVEWREASAVELPFPTVPDELVLPMPCDEQMVLRKVVVGSETLLDQQTAYLGVPPDEEGGLDSLINGTRTTCALKRRSLVWPGHLMPPDSLPAPKRNKPRASLVFSGAGRHPSRTLRTDRGVDRKAQVGGSK